MISEQKIGFIGCGNMALAIIGGLVKQGFNPSSIMASNRSQEKLRTTAKHYQINIAEDNQSVVDFADVIILAIKPQILPEVCEQIQNSKINGKLIISIAAGISTTRISQLLNQPVAVIRAMPNTPSVIGEGATGLFANSATTEPQKTLAEQIFSAVGAREWVIDESHIDVVTAIAGSSPAYVFLFLQSMIEQAIEQGLPADVARSLASQAVKGAAALALEESSKSLVDLRKAVTSPGGTTAAAISSFEKNQFSDIIKQAITAATARANELGE
jgi:pyrroline-5-carboxylate reductase